MIEDELSPTTNTSLVLIDENDGDAYKKVKLPKRTLAQLDLAAGCIGMNANVYLQNLIIGHLDALDWPLPKKYALMLKEHNKQAVRAQREQERLSTMMQARIARQTFVADAVAYRRPVGRPIQPAPFWLQWIENWWRHGSQDFQPPIAPVDVINLAQQFNWDHSPPERRKPEPPAIVQPGDPREYQAAASWRVLGHVELLRRAPDGSEVVTLWTTDSAPKVGVLMALEDDPWLTRQTHFAYREAD